MTAEVEQGRFNPLNYPLCLDLPRHVNAVAWQEHIPFVMALVQMLRPKVFVELGVHTGDSYLAVCQAVAALNLDTACYGIDTWRGDAHAGFYGEEVLTRLREHHDPLYGKFSRLVQATFDDAASHFETGSVTLLHIDGLHTYEAVKHDFETWKPKLSRNGLVLFHDINVRERDFGVWKVWEEIKVGLPHFEFKHGHGLGVLAVGPDVVAVVRRFLELNGGEASRVAAFFFSLGNRVTLQTQNEALAAAIRERESKLSDYATVCRDRDSKIKEYEAKIFEYDSVVRARHAEIEKLNEAVHELAQLRSRMDSRSYFIGRLITAPWRLIRSLIAAPGRLIRGFRR